MVSGSTVIRSNPRSSHSTLSRTVLPRKKRWKTNRRAYDGSWV